MNRTDRLLAIVLELQARGWQRAEDLAGRFEISKRTIYRDMQALMESGVPVLSEPGRGFALMDGYFLPPLHFTEDEAILLLLGGDLMAQSFDAHYRATAETAMSKITTVLPERLQQRVSTLQSHFQFINDQPQISEAGDTTLRLLRRAILETRRVRFAYFSRPSPHDSPAHSQREADPYALIHVNNAWYLVAYCHLRLDMRHFRLDRLEGLILTLQTFERPKDFTLSANHITNNLVEVKVLFSPDVARWVQEQPSFFEVAAEDHPDGWLVTLRVRHIDEILQWVLGWGARARVLSPVSLQERIQAEAEAMLRQFEPVSPR